MYVSIVGIQRILVELESIAPMRLRSSVAVRSLSSQVIIQLARMIHGLGLSHLPARVPPVMLRLVEVVMMRIIAVR